MYIYELIIRTIGRTGIIDVRLARGKYMDVVKHYIAIAPSLPITVISWQIRQTKVAATLPFVNTDFGLR
jgi:hypothetical protein